VHYVYLFYVYSLLSAVICNLLQINSSEVDTNVDKMLILNSTTFRNLIFKVVGAVTLKNS